MGSTRARRAAGELPSREELRQLYAEMRAAHHELNALVPHAPLVNLVMDYLEGLVRRALLGEPVFAQEIEQLAQTKAEIHTYWLTILGEDPHEERRDRWADILGRVPTTPDELRLDEQMTLGERINYVREQQGLSTKTVADHCGVHIATVYRWQRGEVIPETAHRLAMAELFNCPPVFLTALLPGSKS